MKASTMICAIGGSLVLGLSTVAPAQSPEQARIEALERTVAELQQQQQNEWLTERRKAEVKGLVREVLQDAETRASLLESGMSAGHDGSNYYLQSSDGGFRLNISGQVQFRHIFNSRDDDSAINAVDDEESGFELPRARLRFEGHIADPRITYAIQLNADKYSNVVYADEIWVGYKLSNSITVRAGETKAPFLREELISSRHQLAVERSYASEVFTLDTVQGLFLEWRDASVLNDMIKVNLSVNDGLRSGDGSSSVNPYTQLDTFGGQPAGFNRTSWKGFEDDATDFAITGRIDLRLMGEWEQWDDFTSWAGEDHALFVGGAVHWEQGETGDTFLNNNFFMWTIDAAWEYNGFNVFGSVTGMHTDNESTSTFANAAENDLYSFVLQGGYNMPFGDDSIEPFIRYEYVDYDNAFAGGSDTVDILTFGVNYYFTRHDAKFTVDLVWAMDEINVINSTNQGLLLDAAGQDDQVVLRTQFQLLF